MTSTSFVLQSKITHYETANIQTLFWSTVIKLLNDEIIFKYNDLESMSTKSDREKLLQKCIDLRKEQEKQVNCLTNEINDIEENLIRNKQSYEIQMQKINQLFQNEVRDRNEEISRLKDDLEIQLLLLKQIEKWLKATRGWILIRKYFYEQKYRKWKMELLRTYQIRKAHEEFNKAIFGNEANHPIWKISINSTTTSQNPTTNRWINEQSWLHYRKQIIESQLSTKTKDEIKCIQNKLNDWNINQQIFYDFLKRKSLENDEVYAGELNKLEQEHESTKYPYSINHPLHIHEKQLTNIFNQIKTVQRLNVIELNSKENDLRSLLTYIGKLKFDLDNRYIKYTQMSSNEIDKRKQKLTEFLKVLNELKKEETERLNKLIDEVRTINKTRNRLKTELKYLKISQNINALHRFTYFDYRFNLPLCKL
ncbi:unnamed protein product [Schistosoma turkestanicum]|nr:unnamed protein product [Schistosoma turkestanicum]